MPLRPYSSRGAPQLPIRGLPGCLGPEPGLSGPVWALQPACLSPVTGRPFVLQPTTEVGCSCMSVLSPCRGLYISMGFYTPRRNHHDIRSSLAVEVTLGYTQ